MEKGPTQLAGNTVGGAHLHDDGLHLGHYYGSIRPLIDHFGATGHSFFLIGDLPYVLCKGKNYREAILTVLSQLVSLNVAYSLNLVPIRQSILRRITVPLQDVVSAECTYAQMKQALPPDSRYPHTRLSVLDLTFPIRSAVEVLALDGRHLLLTGNDADVAKLVRFVGRRLRGQSNSEAHLPELYYPRSDYMRGHNYRKMSQANQNTILLGDTPSELRPKVRRLFDLGRLARVYPESLQNGQFRRDAIIWPVHSLPAQYSRQLLSDTTEITVSDSTGRQEEILEAMRIIHQAATCAGRTEGELIEFLERGEALAKSVAGIQVENLSARYGVVELER